MEENQRTISSLTRAFQNSLDRHGHGFHYSVLAEAMSAEAEGTSKWVFECSEFPVRARSSDTRIDFILRHKHAPIYLVAECKRVNPKLGNWCFARVPFTRRGASSTQPFIVECVEVPDVTPPHVVASALEVFSLPDSYHIGLEVRTEAPGDTQGNSRGAIEEALTQVCRGRSGLISTVSAHRHVFLNGNCRKILLIPVIFTTAELWTSDANLAAADVISGNMPNLIPDLRKRDWIAYQYNQSIGITREIDSINSGQDISGLLRSEFVRTVPIVNSLGIKSFLSWASEAFT